mgnify:CR=1 FL=1
MVLAPLAGAQVTPPVEVRRAVPVQSLRWRARDSSADTAAGGRVANRDARIARSGNGSSTPSPAPAAAGEAPPETRESPEREQLNYRQRSLSPANSTTSRSRNTKSSSDSIRTHLIAPPPSFT